MKRILTTIFLITILPLILISFSPASADEYGKEERKYYEEQEREARKHREEQEREARKHHEEREREERKHYDEKRGHDEEGEYYENRHHEYRYYPSAKVYYDTKKKVYFYLEGDKWGVSVNLPGGINLDVNDYVTIQSDSEQPYDNYIEHRDKYDRHK